MQCRALSGPLIARAVLRQRVQRMDDYLTVTQLCAKLHLSRATIYRLLAKGLPSVKVGGSRRFSWSMFEAWLQGREGATEAERAPSRSSPEMLQPGDYQCLSCGWIGHVPTPTPRQRLRCLTCQTQGPQVALVQATL